MEKPKVVALMSHALYSAGVISRLEQFDDHLDLIHYDPTIEDVLDLIEAQRPSVVIMDVNFEAAFDRCSLDELMHRFPSIKVIRLDPEREGFEIVTSERRAASAVDELLDVITSTNNDEG